MLYKTMILGLLQQRPEYHEQLRQERKLLTMIDRYALELKTGHEAWKDQLSLARPQSDPNQIASEALELAISDLETHLPPASPQDEETLSLDDAMHFLRTHRTPRA